MSVLLTGATGFLGNNLLRLLNARNHPVVAIVRSAGIPESLEGLQFTTAGFDLATATDRELRELPEFELCIHSAALIQIGWSRLDGARRVNVEATRRLARLCLERRARMVLVSTVNTLACSETPDRIHAETDREPPCPAFCYPVTKREGESAVRQLLGEGLDAVIVHAGFMLGRWDWRPSSAEMMIAVAKQRPPFAPGGGTNTAGVVDVAEGVLLAAAAGRSGESYILGGENLSYFELWSRMAEAAGVRGPRFRLPNWLAMGGGRVGDLWGKIRGREGSLNSAASRMGQLFHYYTSQKAASELGYRFAPVDSAIRQSAEWCRERGWIR